jgi:mannose-6-phosphate isomerase-like protein (cupin superfamily)
VGYRAVTGPQHAYEERPYREDEPPRLAADLTSALGLGSSRARLWRYPPRTRGRRHLERAQEEVFVVLEGTLTMLLGDPADRIELPAQSVVAVEPGTPIQVRNDSDAEAVVFVYGAPPEAGTGQLLDELD